MSEAARRQSGPGRREDEIHDPLDEEERHDHPHRDGDAGAHQTLAQFFEVLEDRRPPEDGIALVVGIRFELAAKRRAHQINHCGTDHVAASA